MNGALLQAGAAVLVLTAIAHSYFGERRLIAPILRIDAPLTKTALPRAVLRFAWHFTSVLGLVIALMLWRGGSQAGLADPIVIAAAGAGLLASGLVDAIWSRFRHLGWPMLTLAGALTLSSFL